MFIEFIVIVGLFVDLCFIESLVIKEKFRLMLIGFYICGVLGLNILRLFVNFENVKVLCNVVCCYYFMSEKFVISLFEEKGIIFN